MALVRNIYFTHPLTHSLTSVTEKDAGFRGRWRRVKPRHKPEEGMPFDTKDTMFNPPLILSGHPSVTLYEYDPAGANTDGNNTPTNYGALQIVP
jgi:hypothetical protein